MRNPNPNFTVGTGTVPPRDHSFHDWVDLELLVATSCHWSPHALSLSVSLTHTHALRLYSRIRIYPLGRRHEDVYSTQSFSRNNNTHRRIGRSLETTRISQLSRHFWRPRRLFQSPRRLFQSPRRSLRRTRTGEGERVGLCTAILRSSSY